MLSLFFLVVSLLVLIEFIVENNILRYAYLILNLSIVSFLGYLDLYSLAKQPEFLVLLSSICISIPLGIKQSESDFKFASIIPWIVFFCFYDTGVLNFYLFVIAIYVCVSHILHGHKEEQSLNLNLYFITFCMLLSLIVFSVVELLNYKNLLIMKMNISFAVFVLLSGSVGLNKFFERLSVKLKKKELFFLYYLLFFLIPSVAFIKLNLISYFTSQLSLTFNVSICMLFSIYFVSELNRTKSKNAYFVRVVLKICFLLILFMAFTVKLTFVDTWTFLLVCFGFLTINITLDYLKLDNLVFYNFNVIKIICLLPLIFTLGFVDIGKIELSNFGWFFVLLLSLLPCLFIKNFTNNPRRIA